jgi:large subunit ribosomal protein L35
MRSADTPLLPIAGADKPKSPQLQPELPFFGIQTTRGRLKRSRVSYPQISLKNPKDWNRPIVYGVLPAYDEALGYIMEDSAVLKKEAEELRVSMEKEEEDPDREEGALEKKRERLDILEIQSEINLPEVRWKVDNNMGRQLFFHSVYGSCIALADMTRPVHRHLLEQRWREEGALDLLVGVLMHNAYFLRSSRTLDGTYTSDACGP